MIKLDLYRLLPETSLEAYEEADVDCMYTPYRVFVIESRLYPFIYKMFPKLNIYIYLKSLYNPKTYRMDVYLTITKIDKYEIEEEEIVLTKEEKEKIEDKMNKITSENIDYALIDINELYDTIGVRYPFSWFRSVLEYTGIDNSYNPFIRPEGIYLSFNPNSDYKKAYFDVCIFLKERISEFYSRGIIVLDNVIDSKKKEKLIQNWKLVSLVREDEEEKGRIFEPAWRDARFARNQVDFLLRKIEEDSYIRIELPDNLVKRHEIMKNLQIKEVESNYVKIKVENLEEAQKIASLITHITQSKNKTGRVLVLAASRLSEIYLFLEYADKYQKGESISYSINDNENPYIFSCLLKEDDYMSLETLKERFRNYALDRLIEVSKISKLKNMSPHDIIEQEYQ